jgi:hypothetical protein
MSRAKKQKLHKKYGKGMDKALKKLEKKDAKDFDLSKYARGMDRRLAKILDSANPKPVRRKKKGR